MKDGGKRIIHRIKYRKQPGAPGSHFKGKGFLAVSNFSDLHDEFSRRYAEGGAEAENRSKGRAFLCPFEGADVTALRVGKLGKTLPPARTPLLSSRHSLLNLRQQGRWRHVKYLA